MITNSLSFFPHQITSEVVLTFTPIWTLLVILHDLLIFFSFVPLSYNYFNLMNLIYIRTAPQILEST